MILLGVLKLSCIFVAGALFDSRGRRPLMFASCAGMATAMLLLATHMTGLQTPSDGEAPAADDNCTAEAEGAAAGGAEATSAALPMFALALYMTSFSLGMGPGVRKPLHSAFVLLLVMTL